MSGSRCYPLGAPVCTGSCSRWRPDSASRAAVRDLLPRGHAIRKYDHLQILRAVAASLVVIDHSLIALKDKGIKFESLEHAGDLAGHVGITSFFILSGLIMTLQTQHQFGVRLSPIIFIYRRIVRIVPMYWIATLLWFRGIYISNWPLPHRGTQLMLSLFFIPDYFFPGQGRMYPLLPHGWTLNYEMAFYLLFALALFLPRRFGIALLILLPELLVALGLIYHLPTGETPAAIPGFYLDPIILLLSRGVLIGLVLLELKKFPTIRIPFSPALLLFIPTILMLAFPRTIGAAPLWGPLISYSTVIVLLCLATNQDHLGWVNRTLVLLGDASYSTYLFHLSVYPFLISWVLRGYGRMHATMQSPALFLVLSVVAANILGLGIHLVVERPIIKALRLIRFGPPRVSAESASVGA